MGEDILKEDEEKIEKFEKVNNLKEENYLFATAEKKGFFMFGKVEDEFVYHIIVTLLMEHTSILERVLDNIFGALDKVMMVQKGKEAQKKDPNSKLN